MFFIEPLRRLYGRFERPISSLSLLGGFIFDAFTLRRVDTFFENLWILGHLVIIGIFIIVIHLREHTKGDERDPHKAHFWYVNILQFFFGGTLSAYLVFYFRSTDIFTTWPFIFILALAFWANESLKRHYVRFSFQVTLFFLSVYSFSIFLVPIMLHRIGSEVFLISGIWSLIFIMIFTGLLFHFTRDRLNESKHLIISQILGVFILVNVLYFTDLIPPIPLSLKDAGIYHEVEKISNGSYAILYEQRGWREYFKLYPDFHVGPGMPVYAFSAIFSPKDLNLTIIHEWEYYNEEKNDWITESTIKLPVVGGRDSGFRTFSTRSNLREGKWRVNIKTEGAQTIGHLRFNLVPVLIEPPLFDMVR